jgi:subtilisin family serine protease
VAVCCVSASWLSGCGQADDDLEPQVVRRVAEVSQAVDAVDAGSSTGGNGTAKGAAPFAARFAPAATTGEVLVQFRQGLGKQGIANRVLARGSRVLSNFSSRTAAKLNDVVLAQVPAGLTVEEAVQAFEALPDVELAQPNYIYKPSAPYVPNDTHFALMWGLNNTAQAPLVGTLAARADSDIDWPEAWERINASAVFGSDVVVAVIDTGVDYTHPDLDGVIWTNPGEIPNNNIDDDLNGFIDDIHGYDFFGNGTTPDPDPMDEPAQGGDHGTHVSGTIASEINNNEGTTGIASHVRIMALRFLGPDGGTTADAIKCINYAVDNGAQVLNNSWGGGAFDPLLFVAIQASNTAGTAFIAAAGNDGLDTDIIDSYPAGYEVANVVSVAASDRRDGLTSFSNWGRTTVDIAAPGEEIASTVPAPDSYLYMSGTSMATPHVSGAVALALVTGQANTAAEAIDLMYRTAEPIPAAACRTVTGTRLNIANLVARGLGGDTTAPAAPTSLALLRVGPDNALLQLTAPGDDVNSGQANRYEVHFAPTASWTNFAAAPAACGYFRPSVAGASDVLTLTELQGSTAYTAQLRAIDEAGNLGGLSNLVTFTTTATLPVPLWNDVEGDTSAFTSTSGQQWGIVQAPTPSPTHAFADGPIDSPYINNANSALFSPSVSLPAATKIKLSFDQAFITEETIDLVTIGVAQDGSATYTALAAQSGSNAGWRNFEASLDAYAGHSIKLRFLLTSNSFNFTPPEGLIWEGWSVDNIKIAQQAALPTVLVNDAFGSAANWTLQGSWTVTGNQLREASGNYGNDLRVAATLNTVLNLADAEEAELQFLFNHALESGFDYLFLEASTDNDRWAELKRWTGAMTSGASYTERISLARFLGQSAVRLRFVLQTDDSQARAGVVIDDFLVRKRSDGCPSDPNKSSPGACGCGVADTDGDGDGTPNCTDGCPSDANKTTAGQCGCGNLDTDSDGDGTANCNDGCPSNAPKTSPGVCGCATADTDSDSDGTPNCNDGCPNNAPKTSPGVCGCATADTDSDSDGTPNCNDGCPNNAPKTAPGVCGCATADTDSDGDGTPNCTDNCPSDPNKIAAGQCGCGNADTDSDGDGTANCNDGCPNNAPKTAPGACGCATADTDSDGDGTPNCNDGCPSNAPKIAPGVCGCATADTDSDGDGTPNCNDSCPNNAPKTSPGVCGCATADTDGDSDGTPNCNDACPSDPNKIAAGQCGCGNADTDSDGDGTANCNDGCPSNSPKTAPGVCGCATADTDSDGDGTPDCNDNCPSDPNKIAVGQCGCGNADTDSDGDGTANCNDGCPSNSPKIAPGVCGCAIADTDGDGDGTPNCNDGCPTDPNKIAAGTCGCGIADGDSDGDGTINCSDGCPSDPNKIAVGVCGCGVADTDSDGDGTSDCDDGCEADPDKTEPGVCGCDVADTDTDSDGTEDCDDGCVDDTNKTSAGECGCGEPEVVGCGVDPDAGTDPQGSDAGNTGGSGGSGGGNTAGSDAGVSPPNGGQAGAGGSSTEPGSHPDAGISGSGGATSGPAAGNGGEDQGSADGGGVIPQGNDAGANQPAGCGCRTVATPSTPSGAWVVCSAALAAAVMRRRRKNLSASFEQRAA